MEFDPKSPGTSFFMNHVNPDECPFFLYWVLRKMIQAYRLDVKVKRKGLPKAGPHPMICHKRILALAKIQKKLKLKDFSQAFDLSYGVVRLWNRELRVDQRTWAYRSEFVNAYLQELEKRYFSPKMDFTKYDLKTTQKAQQKIDWFLWEATNYDFIIQWRIINAIEKKLKLPSDNKSWELLFYSLVKAFDERNIYDPPRDKKEKALFEKQIRQEGELSVNIMKRVFGDLRRMIKARDTRSTMRFVDWLENSILATIESKIDLKIAVINKGKKKGTKKEGENAGDEKLPSNRKKATA